MGNDEKKSQIPDSTMIKRLKDKCREILKITKEKNIEQIDSIIPMLEKIENSLTEVIQVKENFENPDKYSQNLWKAYTEKWKIVEKNRRDMKQKATQAIKQMKDEERKQRNQEKLARAQSKAKVLHGRKFMGRSMKKAIIVKKDSSDNLNQSFKDYMKYISTDIEE